MSAVCPACSGALLHWRDVSDKLTNLGNFPLSRCAGCGVLAMQPMPSAAALERFYPGEYWYQESDQTFMARLEWRYRRLVLLDHVSFVSRFLAQSSRVLDIGCSSGTFLYLISRRGHEVRGLDFSPAAAAEAMRRYHVPVEIGSLASHLDQLRAWKPQAITMFHVLEHLPDPLSTLKNIHLLLGSAGQLFLQVPNLDSWQSRLFATRWYGLDVPRHVVNFTARGLRVLLERAGFRVTHVKRFSLRDNSASLISSMFPALDPLRNKVAGDDSRTGTLLYAGLVALAQPVVALESISGHGGTLFVRALKTEIL
jgi:SAM-dependent methyltransferase